MSTDLILAEFLDRCCFRYAKHPDYRRALRRERPAKKTTVGSPTPITMRRSA